MTETKEFTDIGEFIAAVPIPEKWKREALPLFLTVHDMKRILAWQELYSLVLDLAGDIFEFGVGYGRDLNILACLRALMEPNAPRRVIGFDLFSGGLRREDIGEMDGPKAEPGYYEVDENYLAFLQQILAGHVSSHPSSDKTPFVLVPGPVQDTVPAYLAQDETPIALAFFDMLVYDPTLSCLRAIRDRLTRGSVLAFNQFKTPAWQIEAKTLREVFGFDSGRLRRSRYHRYWAYMVIE